MSAEDPSERRAQSLDRREQPTKMVSRYLLVGRRRGGRREGETETVYVDRPGRWVVLAFGVIVGLSLLDAWFTLEALKSGATEGNPVMQAALNLGDRPFVLIKTVITMFAVGFLCLHKNWPLGRMCLGVSLVGYSALIIYHLHLQAVLGRL